MILRVCLALLCSLLIVGLWGCGASPDPQAWVTDRVWELQFVSNEQGTLQYRGLHVDGDQSIPLLPVELKFHSDGTVIVAHAWEDQEWEGVWEKVLSTGDSVLVDLRIGEAIGQAVIGERVFQDGTRLPSLTVTIGEYISSFLAES